MRKHTKYFNGVAIKLLFPQKRKNVDRLVQVGMLQFNSEYTAKRFIKSLTSR